VAFGAAGAQLPSASPAAAIALAVGIGLQNFPEGAAVSIRCAGKFLPAEEFLVRAAIWPGRAAGRCGGRSGGPPHQADPAYAWPLPGAMIYVVVEELIPESQLSKNSDISTLGAMLGFAVMMTLDVALS